MTALAPQVEETCTQDTWDFSDLRALFINTTLKKSPEISHTQGVMDISIEISGDKGSPSTRFAPSTTT